MTNPADQHSLTEVRRSADPPTLWLSLALGSVLIHLVLFILASLAATQTAKVQLDLKPIAVEFVDPNTVVQRAEAPNPTIAARPVTPSASTPSTTQAQPPALPQSSDFVPPPVEQPFVPQIARRNRVRAPIQQPQPEPIAPPVPQPRNAPTTPTPPQSNPPNQALPSQEPPPPTTNTPQGAVPGSDPNPSNNTLPPAASEQPVEGQRITQLPQGASVAVTVSNPRPPLVDIPEQLAQPIDLQKNISISYPSTLAGQTIRLEATLVIDNNGLMLDVSKTSLRSSSSSIDSETLKYLAEQIFSQWQFKPAQDNSNGKLLTPLQSNLTVDAEVTLP
ncbi:hypothetical protein H6F86_02645 [Phormidium sp. FACHB-592]|uniref:TonB C-terminal domain-containing protein n=1 Tax=Stenomitos frigidus AS-A4 TaxID=2933935 RepID=A0ABV0KK31_9CYAN|nr:hypothetical protein [Phormidium sp. FACHB-592]MBD2072806.1 hypothetical protein [Phormidium sp. FACHB-592]